MPSDAQNNDYSSEHQNQGHEELPQQQQSGSLHKSLQNTDESVEGQSQQQQSVSDGSLAAPGDENEYIIVHLPDIRKEVQCPICLGIIRKTRTVMDCLHRFCSECINKAFRLGNHECPACRRHCASRRSLRDDPKYDALISAFYPDIDKCEEEEWAFHEEERVCNEQLQASIAQTTHRQSEARGKKRSRGK